MGPADEPFDMGLHPGLMTEAESRMPDLVEAIPDTLQRTGAGATVQRYPDEVRRELLHSEAGIESERASTGNFVFFNRNTAGRRIPVGVSTTVHFVGEEDLLPAQYFMNPWPSPGTKPASWPLC